MSGNYSHRRGAKRSILLLLAFTALTYALPGQTPGTLDPSFGVNGQVRTRVGTEDRGNAVAIQQDGKIVVVGRSRPGATYFDYAIARYNVDGSLDNTFAGAGSMMFNLFPGFATDDEAYAVLIDSAGRILVLGSARGTSGAFYRTGLIRFNPDGTPDSAFGTGGRAITERAVDRAMALQADGKIVCGGGGGDSQQADYRLQRFNTDGTIDMTFGVNGFVQIDFAGSGDGVWGIAIQPDGKIIAAGRSRTLGGDDNFAVARLNTDGSLDTTFGSGGKVTTDFDGRPDFGYAVTLQPDGKIIVVGQARTDVNKFDFGVVSYNPDGSLDTTFGQGGRVRTGFGAADSAYAVKLQLNGKIVAAGVEGGVSTGFAVARYNADGSLDTTFDGDGRATAYFVSRSNRTGRSWRLARRTADRSSVNSLSPDFSVIRSRLDHSQYRAGCSPRAAGLSRQRWLY